MRQVRYRARFRSDLAAQLTYLRRNRPPVERERLREAIGRFGRIVAGTPGIGEPFEMRGTTSYRVFPLTARLPYLVLYSYDTASPAAVVWLEMLVHESQDRERFDPAPWD